jgi:hypothetical protein
MVKIVIVFVHKSITLLTNYPLTRPKVPMEKALYKGSG